MATDQDRPRAVIAPAVFGDEVVVRLGGRAVVDRVALQVPTGSWLGLIGPNGAGKSTLLQALAGLRRPDGGRVEVDGVDPHRVGRRTIARHVAVVAQHPILPPGMPVFDYVLLGRTAHLSFLRSRSRRDLDIVSEVLADLDLDPLAGREVDQLSGGEAQRVAVARALAQQAPVLLLDEPTSSLDVGHQQEVLELVDRLRRERGLTVVAAMHDLTTAGQFSDALLLLDQGRAVANGEVTSVLDAERIARHYRAHVTVVEQPDGTLAVVPRRLADRAGIRRDVDTTEQGSTDPATGADTGADRGADAGPDTGAVR